MFLFKIKADASDIDVPVVRALIGTAVIFCLLYRQQHNPTLATVITVLIFITLLFTQTLLVKYKINPLLLMSAIAVLAFMATHSFIIPLIILSIMIAIKIAYVHPSVEINEEGIEVRKTFSTKTYDWQSFGNIILKDKLLTLDFKNNKVLQLEIESDTNADEKQFNDYCNRYRNAD